MSPRVIYAAAPIALAYPGLSSGKFQDITRQALPTPVAADAVSQNCRIHRLTIHNNGGSNSNITVHDKQGSPAPIIPDQTLPPGGFIDLTSSPGDLCSGGFTWSASTASVYGYGVVELV